MTEQNNNEIELEAYITKAVQDIEKAAGDRKIDGTVKFKVVVTKTIRAGGDIKIYVAKGGGEYSRENISQIEFEIYPKRRILGKRFYDSKFRLEK